MRYLPAFAIFLRLLLTASLSYQPVAYAESTVQRLISVDGNATEIMIELDRAADIIAADITSQPLLKQAVDNLGYHRTLSAEALLALQPDIVIGSDHMGPQTVISALKKAKVPVLQLKSPENLQQLSDNIRRLSAQLHASEKGQQLIADVQSREQALKRQRPKKQAKMVFLLDIGRGLSQAGTDTAGDALIALLGGLNQAQFSGYKSISVEALLVLNPDIILVGSRSDNTDSAETLLQRAPLLQQSEAGKKQQIISVNAATLIAGISLGALAEAERIAQTLYQHDTP